MDAKLELVTGPRPLPAPRGPMITAARIVERFFTDEAGKPLVSEKWVRAKVPGKVVLSYNRVAWYVNDVQAWIDSRQQKAAS